MTEITNLPYRDGVPFSTATPFTYREGATVLQLIRALKDWAGNVVPELNDALNAFWDKYLLDHQAVLDDIITTKDEWQALFDQFMADVVAQLEVLNDQAVSALVEDSSSETRNSLNENFANYDEFENFKLEMSENLREAGALNLDSIDVLTTFSMYDMETPRLFMQGFSINAEDNELYVSYGASSDTRQKFEVRDLTTGERKSYRVVTAEQQSYTEGLPWWKVGDDLHFIVRLKASATTPYTYQVYNYTKDELGPYTNTLGRVRADVVNNFYITSDGYGNRLRRFYVYDWASVRNNTPTQIGHIPNVDMGLTYAKIQAVTMAGGRFYVYGGAPTENPTLAVYDTSGKLVNLKRWDRDELRRAINTRVPNLIKTADYEWEAEGATNYNGRVVTGHVVWSPTDVDDDQRADRKVVIMVHGVPGGTQMNAELILNRDYDTDWRDAEYLDGFGPVASNRRLQFRRIGDMVFWRGSVKKLEGTFTSDTYTAFAAQPSDLVMPWYPMRFRVGSHGAHGDLLMEVRNQLRYYPGSGVNTGQFDVGGVVYITS